MMRPRAVVLLLAVVLLASAVAAGAPAQPRRGGRLVIATSTEANTFDVHRTNASGVLEGNFYVYETLTERDDQGRVIPALARSWQVTNGGKTVTISLQDGVKFHDGTPFNAGAVKFNLERKLREKLPVHELTTAIDTMDVVNDTTLRLNLTHPALALMGTFSAKTFGIISPAAVQKYGRDIAANPVGTGPFRMVEWRKGQFIRFRRNPDYWRKGLPYLDEIVLRTVPDIAVRAQTLEAGEVDVGIQLSDVDVKRLQGNPAYTVIASPGWVQYYMPMNNHDRRGTLNDVRVRQAINHAVDRKAMVDTIFLGVGARIADSPIVAPGVFGYVPIGTYSYDPARARALLAEAGWRPGASGLVERDGRPMRLRLISRRGGSKGDIQVAETVQAQLRAIGIEVRIDVLEGAIFLQTVTQPPERGDYDMLNLTFGTFTGDADYALNTFFSCNAWAPKLYNRMYYCNRQLEAILENANKATDNPTRLGLYQEALKIAFRDAPFLMLFDTVFTLVTKAGVHGVELHKVGNYPARFAWRER
ncbi:MAG: hypothetical protein HY660_15750 [Armatimonadetes bacterium]|nr:hypothetical protein [Armatimonadota bacterium]